VERMLLFTALILLYFGLFIIPVSVALEFLPRRLFHGVYPSFGSVGAYRHIALTLVLVGMVFYALIFSADPNELLVLSMLVPLSAVVITILKLQSKEDKIQWTARVMVGAAVMMLVWKLVVDRTGGWPAFLPVGLICCSYYLLSLRSVTEYVGRSKTPSLPSSFSLAAFLLLLLVSGLPCIALFKLAYDFSEHVSTEREQLFTMAALEQREQEVFSQYTNIQVSKQTRPLGDDLGKWLFLRRR